MQITFRIDYNGAQAYNLDAKTRKKLEKAAFDQTFPEFMDFISDFFKENLCKGYDYKLSFSQPTKVLLGEDRSNVLESIVRTQNFLANKKRASVKSQVLK